MVTKPVTRMCKRDTIVLNLGSSVGGFALLEKNKLPDHAYFSYINNS